MAPAWQHDGPAIGGTRPTGLRRRYWLRMSTAGPADYAVEHNGKHLGIDFGAIEPVVLSHGRDHGHRPAAADRCIGQCYADRDAGRGRVLCAAGGAVGAVAVDAVLAALLFPWIVRLGTLTSERL